MTTRAMTVRELIAKLQEFDPDWKVRDDNTGRGVVDAVAAHADFAKPGEPKIVWLEINWQEHPE